MKKYLAFLPLSVFLVSCGGTGSSGGGGGGGGGGSTAWKNFVPTTQFGVYNNCPYTVWLQARNQPSSDNAVIQVNAGSTYNYHVNGQAVPSFVVWPKTGCDSSGDNCLVGQEKQNSNGQCPTQGCQPAIDSLFEASFNTNGTSTFDGSNVNGYTLPYYINVIKATNETNLACSIADASKLDINNCPSTENLSTPKSQMAVYGSYFPPSFGDFTNPNDGSSLVSENLQLISPVTGNVIGCAAPYQKLIASTIWGGLNIGNTNSAYSNVLYDQVVMYSNSLTSSQLIFPSTVTTVPPGAVGVSSLSDYCHANVANCVSGTNDPNGLQATDTYKIGPITHTQYVNYIHSNTTNVYAWQYDDSIGTRTCNSNQSKVAFVLCP